MSARAGTDENVRTSKQRCALCGRAWWRRGRGLLRRTSARWVEPRASDLTFPQSILLASLSVAAFSFVRWMIDPVVEHRVPYVLFLGAVVISTLRGGWRCGTAATVESLLVGTWLFTMPRRSLLLMHVDDVTAAAIFIAISGIVIAALEAETRARRQVEERDRLLAGEYEQRAQLERELEQSRRLESLGRLAGGVAHDFNNLLTVISGAAELLRAQQPSEPLVESIGLAAARSSELTKQLLSLGRRQMLQLTPMSLREPVEEGLRFARQLVPEDIQLFAELEPNAWLFEGDASGMQQILLNLVTNARDALPEGGLIRVTTANVVADEAFIAENPGMWPGEYVQLSVIDSGVGMSLEIAEHVFEPFFTTKAEGRGAGLGLSVTYGIVKQLKGHIFVRSQLGKGTQFVVYFPRVPGAPGDVAAPPSSARKQAARRLRVLLVEDNELVRNVITDMLQALGHEVKVSRDGRSVIEDGAAFREVDVVLTDVVMPRMNGPQLAEQLAALRPELPVVLMSGYTDSLVLQRGGLRFGILLKKPFSKADLDQALERAIARAVPSA